MQFCPYNSRDIKHKAPFGAVAAGDEVRLRVLLPRSLGCSGVKLVVHEDDCECITHSFFWNSMNGDSEEWWEITHCFDTAGLYFYHFEYDTPFGTGRIYLKSSGVGVLSPSGEEWQQTVYAAGTATPDWIKGGIMYQIFPDRFCRSETPKKGVPSDRLMHSDTHEQPVWMPDANGEILNNDYYGGDLQGIISKLPYLKALGVTVIYLNPIFEAHSNHRYNTADYSKIDSLLGSEDDLIQLCASAKKLGIRIIADGVFSHTGSDSIYFNKEKRYGGGGAYNDAQSPYRPWYSFKCDNSYKCWWNILTLPETNEDEPSYTEFITGENGILKKWLDCGISGWRLDVADELPDTFIDALNKRVKSECPDNLIIGEVWEDATTKISHGGRRRYLLGGQLDSVMNYPFADAILSFMRDGEAEELMETVVSICENYPPQALNTLMNHIGTHDTARILTRLADDKIEALSRREQAQSTLTFEQYEKAKALLKSAAVLQFTLPGFPCIYYGDEAGVTGGSDPFNRTFYPWGEEDGELVTFYRRLCKTRLALPCLKSGVFLPVSAMLSCIAYIRRDEACDSEILVIINRNPKAIDYNLPEHFKNCFDLLSGTLCTDFAPIPAFGAVIISCEN